MAIRTVGGVEVSSVQDIQAASHGGSVMRAGIIFQFSNNIIFAMLLLFVQLQVWQRGAPLSRSVGRPAILAVWIWTIMLLLRNGYRIVGLSDEWDGHIMRTEGYLLGLDMIPMALAIGAFAIFSPSLFLRPGKSHSMNGV